MSSRPSEAAFDRRRLLALIAALAVVSTGAAAAFAAAQTGYAVEFDESADAVDVPHTTYEAEGEMVEVTEIGRTELGGTLDFAVDAPSGEYYTVRVVNGEQDVVETDPARGSESFSLSIEESNGYHVGTYVIAVTYESGDEREVYAAEPFVVQGYDVTHDVPDSVDSDGTITVDVTIAPRDDPPEFDSVTVAVGDDSTRVVTEASRVNDTTYRASIDADQFEDGEYTVVSGVRGDLAFDDTAREYYGVSDDATVRVADDSGTATATETATGSGGDSGTESTTDTATTTATTETPTSNGTATASDTTDTATTDASETTTPGPTVGPTTTAPPATTSPTDTATPSPDDESGGDGDDSGGSGASTETTGALVHPLGLALLVAVGLVALRRREP